MLKIAALAGSDNNCQLSKNSDNSASCLECVAFSALVVLPRLLDSQTTELVRG